MSPTTPVKEPSPEPQCPPAPKKRPPLRILDDDA
jgi:hypothetical protein